MIQREDRGTTAVLHMTHGKANAIDLELFEELTRQLRALAEEDTVRAAVLTGTGTIFCAGVDLLRVVDGGTPYLERFLALLANTVRDLFAWPKPLVVAVNGHALAGGCVLAAAADHQVMTDEPRARIGLTELLVGVPFPTAALEIMRYRAAAHLESLVLGARRLDPQTAEAIGLVNELAPAEEVLDRACAVAEQLGKIPPAAFALSKEHLRREVIERIDRLTPEIDPQVLRIWSDPETLKTIRTFLEATLGKR